jgi:hypothetical protein
MISPLELACWNFHEPKHVIWGEEVEAQQVHLWVTQVNSKDSIEDKNV